MPSSVNSIFSSSNAVYKGVVKWGQSVPISRPGVYAVSSSSDPTFIQDSIHQVNIDHKVVEQWVSSLPRFELDKVQNPNFIDVIDRLMSFWLQDEHIVYIGKATSLRSRISQYYRTPLGARRPHAGGHWIKTLSNLNSLFVHYGISDQPKKTEDLMLQEFIDKVSNETLNQLFDPDHPFPFANLEYPQGNRKRHGIGKSKQ